MTKHIPVLQKEALTGAEIKKGDVVVDATLGGGGYTRALLAMVGDTGQVIALDRDQSAIARFRNQSADDAACLTLVHANFAMIEHIVHDRGVVPMAIIADLGLSSDQLDDPQRGLSFLADGPLDMRLDRTETVTAADLVATLSAKDLAALFRRYGDEPFAGVIARRIVAARTATPIRTTRALAEIIESAVPARAKRSQKHPATRVFQALRIAVNHEYDDLEQFLAGALEVLAPGGRLCVVSFHSGEDAIVKHFMRAAARGCICPPTFPICQCGNAPRAQIVTKRPILPSTGEVRRNPRARSAKLRILRKVGT